MHDDRALQILTDFLRCGREEGPITRSFPTASDLVLV